MQTIYRTSPASNFTVFSNELITNSLPAKAYRVLCYLLSKPPHWKKNNADIANKLSLSAYAVKQALRQIREAGYAIRDKFKNGYSRWFFFDNPQTAAEAAAQKTAATPAMKPKVEKPTVENRPVLVNKEKAVNIEKPQHAAPTPPIPAQVVESKVVVSSDELIYPVQLNPVQKKAARAVIKKVKQPEIQQEVLFALAYAIASGTVKSPVAYLNGLVTRANNGTFEPVTATTASKQGGKPLIPVWQGFGQSTPSKPEVASGFIEKMKAAARGAK